MTLNRHRSFGTTHWRVALLPLVGAMLVAQPAQAQPSNAVLWQSEIVSAASGDFVSFYAHRSGPLWIDAEGRPNAAAEALLDLVESAELDGLDRAAVGYNDLTAAMTALTQDASPTVRASAEVTFSKVFTAYVGSLRDTSGTQMLYEHDLLRPFVPESYTTLEAAAGAASLVDYVRNMQWMHPLYAQLRQAAIAGPSDASTAEATRANLQRLRALPASPGERYVLIDAASATLWMYENGQPVDSMRVVVGKAETQTPIMAGYIRYAVFNPYWNVPTELIQKTIAPRARAQGDAYLKRGGYQVVSDWTADADVLPSKGIDWRAVAAGELDIKVRQLPSRTNAMGSVKYEFPNPLGIYLHDTPDRSLLLKDARQFSNGCIRLEDAERFGRWLMNGELPAVSEDPEQKVDLPTSVPIYVTYLTVQPIGSQLAVRADPYGMDASAQALALSDGLAPAN